MKWKSTNVLYLLGICPPLLCLVWLACTALSHFFARAAVVLTCAALLAWLFRKVRCLPYPQGSYKTLAPLHMALPGDFGVTLCTDESLAEHDFLLRTAEFVSPLRFRGERPRLVLNSAALESEGPEYMEMAAVREIGRYKLKIQLKTVLRLTLPLLLLAMLILFVCRFGVPANPWIGPSAAQLILPLVCTLLLTAHIWTWNKSVSANDGKLDRFLLRYYPAERVKWFIEKTGSLERRFDKEQYRSFNEHCLRERIQHLGSKE